jgi:phosphogluconate 2-dehydrogenase/gluconate 2-dehydrogenase
VKKSVVVYKRLPAALLARLQDEFNVTCFEAVDAANRGAYLDAIKTAHGIIGSSLDVTNEMLEPASNLRIISTISVGVDQFDVEYLSRRGIMLANTPDVLTETTADAIFSLVLASARRIVELAELVKAGKWTKSVDETHYGVNVHSKTIGVVGMGRIGSAVARRAALGFGMDVLYFNSRPVPEAEATLGARFVSLDQLLSESDFVCVVLPLTAKTERMFGQREFALMRPGAIFINGARGRIVDEAALIDALQQGRIHGAGLDVFEREPLSPDSPLLAMPNVVALPHIGSATHETRFAMAQSAVDNLVAGLRGERPKNLVNFKQAPLAANS